MIHIVKKDIPPVLRKNSVEWTKVLLDHLAAGTQPTNGEKSRYRHPEIKETLLAETAGKCAYCESKLRHITYGDVEHIIPKSVDLGKIFDWSNLTLACDVCNTNKGDHFGNHEDLVDPYVGQPSEHLSFHGPMVLSVPGSGPGQATVSTLELNRMDLIERRKERMESLSRLLHLLIETADIAKRAVLRRDIEVREVLDDKEYAAMSRSFIVGELKRIDEMAGG